MVIYVCDAERSNTLLRSPTDFDFPFSNNVVLALVSTIQMEFGMWLLLFIGKSEQKTQQQQQ